MKINTSYSCRITQYRNIFEETVRFYRNAVDFFIDVCLCEWDAFSDLQYQNQSTAVMERLTVPTAKHPSVKYNFNAKFYKMPCYLRRAAIAEAYGKCCSYKSNLTNWEAEDSATRGKCPSEPRAGHIFPVLYKDNMFQHTDDAYTFRIKVFHQNTWKWLDVLVRKSDVDYIERHCATRTRLNPTLRKRGKVWSLDFAFEERVELSDKNTQEQTILAVDLGLNNAATISAMRSDGAVLGRKFLKLPKEYDSLKHSINRIKKAQQHGNRKTPRLWDRPKGINDRIAVLTANFIVDYAQSYNADVIVFEHLDLDGKKRGSKKQRLHLWLARYVQAMVADKAHRLGMRISHVCAWGTSRLAFDGSGVVLRGREAELKSYSMCRFQNGKVYNCDLSASYNIGARYFIREITKSLSATARLELEAKVPQVSKRSTCTLSTLISLNAVLKEFTPLDAEFGPYGRNAVRCA